MLVDNMKGLREAAGLTQGELAKRLKRPLRTIQNWEQGHREPKTKVMEQIAAALGVSLGELLASPPTKKGKAK